MLFQLAPSSVPAAATRGQSVFKAGAQCPAPAVVNAVAKGSGRGVGRVRSAVRKAERDLAKLRRQAKFFGMSEEEVTLSRVYTSSADNVELSDMLSEDR
jgi:hypothetical protein